MAFYYITGNSGSGKSTVREELERRGYRAPGIDEEGFADWVDRKTGKAIPFPHHDKTIDMHEWYERHEWEANLSKIAALKRQAEKENIPMFVCGAPSGEEKLWHLFDKVFALTIDEATLRHRIATRTGNSYGKTPDELAIILQLHANAKDTYQKSGAILIDAGRPLAQVVDQILAIAGLPATSSSTRS